MSNPVFCPSCQKTQDPQLRSGRLSCPDCGVIVPSDQSGGRRQAGTPDSNPSTTALDEPSLGQQRPNGAMTILRHDLRSEEQNKQGGWLENLLPRRPRIPTEQEPEPSPRAVREPSPAATRQGPRPGSSRRAPERPRAAEVPSTPYPPLEKPSVARSQPPKAAPVHPEASPGARVPIVWGLTVLGFGSIASVALLQGKGLWATSTFLITVFLLGASILGILHRHEAKKAFWQGFALFGWGYMAMAFVPWFPHQAGLDLPTTRLLTYVHARATASAEDPRDSFSIMRGLPEGASTTAEADLANPAGASLEAASAFFVAGELRQFIVVGQCLFALAAALLGSGVARWFYRTNLAPA
jgi:hypothetical protein